MIEGIDLSFLINYFASFIDKIIALDPTAIIISVIVGIVLLAVVFKVSGFVFGLIKRFFLLIIVGLSAYFFIGNYWERIATQDMSIQLIVFGLIGLAFAVAAVITALISFKGHAKKRNLTEEEFQDQTASGFNPTQLQVPQSYTSQALTTNNLINSLKDDRSLLAVLSYVIIAQFGVFSSRTISAPNPMTGLIFLAVFILGAFIFIKTTYHSYLKGITHLIIASIFGLILSCVLAVYWAEMPFEAVLSLEYFSSDALVAFVTGIAISLLMGSKN
jgi:hypothetical protein